MLHTSSTSSRIALAAARPTISGGRKANSCSVLEAIGLVERFTRKRQRYTYVLDSRFGDRIGDYSDLRKMREHYPRWDISIDLEQTIREIVDALQRKPAS
jgi:CDP-paratose 2-epimerase